LFIVYTIVTTIPISGFFFFSFYTLISSLVVLFDSRCIICGNPKKKNSKCRKCAAARRATIDEIMQQNPTYYEKDGKLYG